MSIQQVLLATAAPVPGQQVFTSSTSWTVPSGVFSIAMVCVQQGGDASANGTEVVVSGTPVCRAKNGARIGDGGGDGGAGGAGGLFDPANSGGGVGLLGLGSTGAGGAVANGGGGGGSSGATGSTSVGNDALYGGAPATAFGGAIGASGGALSYTNNVAVTPGLSVTVTVPTGVGNNGAVRIMWGVNRSYPSTNTADM